MVGVRLDDAELLDRLRPWLPYVGRTLYHPKTGGWYLVRGVHLREEDLEVRFSYCQKDNVKLTFDRPIGQLLDGRFVLDL